MTRPRWHDALIVAGIVALLAVGVWGLWWDDVSRALNLDSPAPTGPAPVPTGGT